MKKTELYIYYSNASTDLGTFRKDTKKKASCGTDHMTFEQIVRIAKSKAFFRYIYAYQSVVFYCPSFTSFTKPFLTAVICRLMARRTCVWIDSRGERKQIGAMVLFQLLLEFIQENLTYRRMLKTAERDVDRILQQECAAKKKIREGVPLYLRCDLSYGCIAGGSIGHIAGVLNNLEICTGTTPLFWTTDQIPTVHKTVEQHLIWEKIPYRNVRDAAGIAFNAVLYSQLKNRLRGRKISFIYQRSALNAYAGVKYAGKHHIPFVLEYNGSEIWITDQWGGRKLKTKNLSEKIEWLTFEKADLITCVSTPLKDQLIRQGVKKEKIIVTPNGVDPDIYSPVVDGRCVRKDMGIKEAAVVIGFIGTFGAWHGAEILTQAYVELLKKSDRIPPVHLLLVGDGPKMAEVRKIIQENRIGHRCTLTGIVPQQDGPKYLAACDILVSAQVRNADGTPFFGSPTKLFEYMAMGKAVVASDMDQMAEILEQGKTGMLFEPGNITELAKVLELLAKKEELRKVLGQNARMEVCRNYTWKIHTEKILHALEQIIAS